MKEKLIEKMAIDRQRRESANRRRDEECRLKIEKAKKFIDNDYDHDRLNCIYFREREERTKRVRERREQKEKENEAKRRRFDKDDVDIDTKRQLTPTQAKKNMTTLKSVSIRHRYF